MGGTAWPPGLAKLPTVPDNLVARKAGRAWKTFMGPGGLTAWANVRRRALLMMFLSAVFNGYDTASRIPMMKYANMADNVTAGITLSLACVDGGMFLIFLFKKYADEKRRFDKLLRIYLYGHLVITCIRIILMAVSIANNSSRLTVECNPIYDTAGNVLNYPFPDECQWWAGQSLVTALAIMFYLAFEYLMWMCLWAYCRFLDMKRECSDNVMQQRPHQYHRHHLHHSGYEERSSEGYSEYEERSSARHSNREYYGEDRLASECMSGQRLSTLSSVSALDDGTAHRLQIRSLAEVSAMPQPPNAYVPRSVYDGDYDDDNTVAELFRDDNGKGGSDDDDENLEIATQSDYYVPPNATPGYGESQYREDHHGM